MHVNALYDVIVVGGGPAGSAAALVLARRGARVALVEAHPDASFHVGEGLPPPGVAEIEAIGAAAALVGHDASPGTISAWGSAVPGHHDFLLQPWARGLHLDRPCFDAALRACAVEAGAVLHAGRAAVDGGRAGVGGGGGGGVEGGAEGVRGGGAEGVRGGGAEGVRGGSGAPSGEPWALDVNGATLRAPWVLDASGRAATFARARGATRVAFDAQVAVGGIVAAAGEGPRTVVEAAPDGWWYRARLPDDRVIRLFFGDEPAERRSPEGWRSALAETHLVGAEPAGALPAAPTPLRVLPASTTLLDPLGGPGWLAVGDAACTLDPLSSAGITHAVRSARSAAEAILDGRPEAHLVAARRAFEGLLEGRAAMYARERRWPDRPFWRRRHGGVSMDPATPLGPVRSRLPMLTAAEQAVVTELCTRGCPAAEVVATLCRVSPLSPRRALLALQAARAEGRI